MNNFAGIIPFNTSAAASPYLQILRRKFPRRLGAALLTGGDQFEAIGGFTASALNDEVQTKLFIAGDIFDAPTPKSNIGTAAPGQKAATSLHALILERGLDAMAEVNGQYLALYVDPSGNTIHLLTDHSGVQQIFFYKSTNFFIFASDIKFLLAHPECPSEIDWESGLRRPRGYTVMHSYRSYSTWFRHISLLPEACDCSINLSGREIKQRRFWNGLYDYTPPSPQDQRSAGDVMEEYLALLGDAVRIRIQDGATAHSFLSGGLDSSVLCALAAKRKALQAYSIVTQTTVLEDTTGVCHRLAQDLGFSGEQFLIPYHQLAFDKQRWKQRIWRTESPVNHTDALTKNLLHYAISQHHSEVPYVLSGTGSDQYNGGLVRWVMPDEGSGSQSAANFLKKVKEAGMKRFIARDEDTYWRSRHVVKPEAVAAWAGAVPDANYWMYYVQSALHGETYTLLWDELRAASAHGRSVRFPFLDYRFAQFFASVPERLHKDLFYDKQILRVPARNLLPAYVSDKSKEPAFIPGYDLRFALFDSLTSGPDSILEQAFGDRSTPHPVIDKEQLWARVAAMKRAPEIYEWQDLMHIINLGLLEQLATQDETSLDFEKDLEVPPLIRFDDPEATKRELERRLDIKPETEMLERPLRFSEGCSLVQDFRTGTLFLSKNNVLEYELDAAYAGWIALLKGIDGSRSTNAILEEAGIPFDEVREFFLLAAKERIILLGEERGPRNANSG